MEQKILQLVTVDRLHIPLSSLEQKLKRTRKNSAVEIAADLEDGERYFGERVHANVVYEDKERARGMKEAIAEFEQDFPKYGRILRGKIDEKRVKTETHLYFGTNEGKRLTANDYMGVMQSLGLSKKAASELYPVLMDVSRKLSKARDESRSVIVGSYDKSTK